MPTFKEGSIHGRCLVCNATATFHRSCGHEAAHLTWSNGARTEDAPGSAPAYCPPCWREIEAGRAAREKAYRDAGGTFPSDANRGLE
jgi:hypothetical protein